MNIDTIICGDNVETLSEFPDECIDLTVTSPPYDKLRDYKGYYFDFEGIARQLYRATKIGGIVVWVVGDAVVSGSETGTSFRQALYFKEIGFSLHDTMIYRKSGFSYPSSNRYYQCFEYMFVFSKGKPNTFNPIRDRKNKWIEGPWTDQSSRMKNGELKPRNKKRYYPKEYGVRGNIFEYHNGAGFGTHDKIAYKHPATFPEKLANDHIVSWSNIGDLILDPFVGSGTTCKMAKILGRHFIGIDISQEYCNIARERVLSV